MAAGLSGLADAHHPQLVKLRQQLEGLLPERAAAVARQVAAKSSTLLDHVSAIAPLLMELGSFFLKRMRDSSEQAREAADVEPQPRSWIRRIGYVKPALALTAALGVAYLVGRFHRPATPRAAATHSGRIAR